MTVKVQCSWKRHLEVIFLHYKLAVELHCAGNMPLINLTYICTEIVLYIAAKIFLMTGKRQGCAKALIKAGSNFCRIFGFGKLLSVTIINCSHAPKNPKKKLWLLNGNKFSLFSVFGTCIVQE